MSLYVALLYSVVVTAQRRVQMSDLRDLARSAGFANPRTLVSTGNLIFEAEEGAEVVELERRLERALEQFYGKRIDVVVRTSGAWSTLADRNPFRAESDTDASRVIVRVMASALQNDVVHGLERHCQAGERIALVDGDLWISFSGKPSESRLLSRLGARHLGKGTIRNWNTVAGVAKLLAE
ncbi:DUF1697 domain-containing protein [Sinorhizobium sp. BG8]|uniref:DUF1697 domain-containing protein n=1 Tax=Sinorhizobium sp. BG8 TaxID=2613773 RepID=UPI00193CB713|nr:DUF1697 domain-containing protein [Sinorhizobium sp. BG8]QRM56929.1 DUF1697 domain-containing protein [Sinorhizobium sp. BG8]